MKTGEEIFQESCLAVQPLRHLQTLDSKHLARLMNELEGKRWRRNWFASWTLTQVFEIAARRFIAAVELQEIDNCDD